MDDQSWAFHVNEWQFRGSLRLGIVSKLLSLNASHSDRHTGCRQPHLCAVCSDPLGWQMTPVDLVPAHQPGRLGSPHFLIKNQHLDFVSYSNCMQYLDGVSGE